MLRVLLGLFHGLSKSAKAPFVFAEMAALEDKSAFYTRLEKSGVMWESCHWMALSLSLLGVALAASAVILQSCQ